jgi:hypothetical protein
MKHKIEIAPNLAIVIDGERVIGSKPQGLFLTTEMIVSDEDLKRLADRCLEVISGRKTEPSDSEKPNNSTCSILEQVDKDTNVRSKEPKTKPQTWTKENCKGCKYNEYPYDSGTCFVRVCINGNKYEPNDENHSGEVTEIVEPQTRMTEDDAFYIVFKDLTKDEGLFTGRYDARYGNKHYMYGINSVMEYIAYRVGEDCFNAFNKHFTNNMIKSEEAKE